MLSAWYVEYLNRRVKPSPVEVHDDAMFDVVHCSFFEGNDYSYHHTKEEAEQALINYYRGKQ